MQDSTASLRAQSGSCIDDQRTLTYNLVPANPLLTASNASI
jgi:hypothetical protein